MHQVSFELLQLGQDLFDHALAQRATDLAQPVLRNRDRHLRDAANQFADANVAGSLLTVEEARKQVDQPSEYHASQKTDSRTDLNSITQVDANRAETAKRSDEDAQDARAKDADSVSIAMDISMKPQIVCANVAMAEDLSKQETDNEKHKADRRNSEKNRESRDSHHKHAPDHRETRDRLRRGTRGCKGMPDSRPR